MAQIYGLFSARDGIVRYIGETTYSYTSRFEQHKRDAESPTRRLHKWFHNEWLHGYPIECALLHSCNDSERHQIEREWIGKFPDLLNERKQSPWAWLSTCVRKPPAIPEIVVYLRRHIFNVSGYRGIHYDHQLDLYFVLMYTGRGPEWLLGDETPGWGGNIWFSDLKAAVDARDRRRQQQPLSWQQCLSWLPDKES
jgi:hypothetical protein